MQESAGELQRGVDGKSTGGGVHSSLQLLGCPAEGLPAIVGGAGAVTVTSWRPTLCHLAHCQTPSSNGSVWLVTGAQWLFADDTNR